MSDLDCWENRQSMKSLVLNLAAFFEWHFRSGFHGTDAQGERANRAAF